MKLNTGTEREPYFMVKFEQDENFIGREDIIKGIDRRHTGRQHRVASAGIGGIGESISSATHDLVIQPTLYTLLCYYARRHVLYRNSGVQLTSKTRQKNLRVLLRREADERSDNMVVWGGCC